jgi:hypothetical protein
MVPVLEIPPVKDIAGHGDDKEADTGTQGRDIGGNGVGFSDGPGGGKDITEGAKGKVGRKHPETFLHDYAVVRYGRGDDEPEGDEKQDRYKGDKGIGQDIEDPFIRGVPHFQFYFCRLL